MSKKASGKVAGFADSGKAAATKKKKKCKAAAVKKVGLPGSDSEDEPEVRGCECGAVGHQGWTLGALAGFESSMGQFAHSQYLGIYK